ncbi:hypothetical protein KSC_023030 [Ktedonobacter sp. SOSP1-52]|uniref:hypothetical protein n=1 Tax=Ktedonobacter sp. SOSP1-52 TaxID=2778366 RepID=UPI001915A56D|nr:hypothetical protein [Ktedonobacter sp. SOSP1-52]GHO63411.1 hypothetical protein KSC_023030 [Ktedonobacter sp. SOSP1-52]
MRACLILPQSSSARGKGEDFSHLSRYSVEWQPDERSLARVGNPRLFQHPYQSAQLDLWEAAQVEWYVILRAKPYRSRTRHKRKGQLLMLQLPLLAEDA